MLSWPETQLNPPITLPPFVTALHSQSKTKLRGCDSGLPLRRPSKLESGGEPAPRGRGGTLVVESPMVLMSDTQATGGGSQSGWVVGVCVCECMHVHAWSCACPLPHPPFLYPCVNNEGCISRVPDRNGVSQAWYIAEIHHSGQNPFRFVCTGVGIALSVLCWARCSAWCNITGSILI